jgi:hypothetical protein
MSIMKFGSFAASIAAVGFLVAPLAAQAGTKASAAVAAPVDFGSRASAPVGKKNKLTGGETALLLLALAGGGFGIYKAIDNKDTSRGS